MSINRLDLVIDHSRNDRAVIRLTFHDGNTKLAAFDCFYTVDHFAKLRVSTCIYMAQVLLGTDTVGNEVDRVARLIIDAVMAAINATNTRQELLQ